MGRGTGKSASGAPEWPPGRGTPEVSVVIPAFQEERRLGPTLDQLAAYFADRGLRREGLCADLNVFDPATVGPAVPELVADLPGGGLRLSQRAEGFHATVVAGQTTLRDGEPTGKLPGKLVRRQDLV